MDGSSDGTPNPLNPMSGSMRGGAEPPRSAMPDIPPARPMNRPANHGVIDPMMRSVAHNSGQNAGFGPNPSMSNFDTANAGSDATMEQTFESLTMDDNSLDMLRQDTITSAGPSRAEVVQTKTIDTNLSGLDGANLVAKDSIVEPAGKKGGNKKGLIIGAIVFLVLAIACGVAAIVIIMMGNSGDKVSKAIEKVISGEAPTIVSAQGSIKTVTETSYAPSISTATSTTVDFNGTFDTASGMNNVSADVAIEAGEGYKIPLTIQEMRNKAGDTYFKISGIRKILGGLMGGLTTNGLTADSGSSSDSGSTADSGSTMLKCEDETKCLDTTTVTNCVNDASSAELATDCISSVTVTTGGSTSSLSGLSGMLEVAEDNWILVSEDFAESMEDLDLFDNTSTCLISALSTLPSYSKDIMNKYKANPFITASTDNLGIASKGNTLYKLSFDSEKLSAFANSLGNNGFVNELNACMGGTASNNGTSATMVESIFDNFPTLYTEIDDNNNFTRFYFVMSTADDSGSTSSSSTTTADISLSYPKDFKITEPEDYITMSDLLSGAMQNVLTPASDSD